MFAQIGEQLVATYQDALNSLIAWTPTVLLAVVLIVVALVVAKLVERLLRSVMTRVRFDALVERVGIDQAIQRIGIRESLNTLVPRIVYYLLLILFARTAADAMGLVAISSAIGAFMGYLPNILAALLILVLGGAAAQVAGRGVGQAATNAGIEFGPSLGGLVTGLIMFVLGIMAISQLQIDTDMVRIVTASVLAAMALAFGLAFGLGSRDITRNIIAGYYARKTFEVGREIEIMGERGELVGITPTQTLMQQGDRMVAVSNAAFLDTVVKQ